MKSPDEKHSGWLLVVGIIVGVLGLTAGPALAALTFSGTSITGDPPSPLAPMRRGAKRYAVALTSEGLVQWFLAEVLIVITNYDRYSDAADALRRYFELLEPYEGLGDFQMQGNVAPSGAAALRFMSTSASDHSVALLTS